MGSTITNRHGIAAFDFATVSGCDQLVVGPTNARGVTLDLLMTDVPDQVRVVVVAPIGNSHHSSLSTGISNAVPVDYLGSQLEYSLSCYTGSALAQHLAR